MKTHLILIIFLSTISFSTSTKRAEKKRSIGSQLNRFYQKQKDQITYFLSKSFGNTVGSINFQRFVKSIHTKELQRLQHNFLQPGDLILKKSRGAFTDKLIPGYFNHLALYLGDFQQLKSLKLSNGQKLVDQQEFKKYLTQINLGKTIIDPIRSGVRLSNLKNWKVNDIAIIRPNNYSSKKLSDALFHAIKYVGTKYDFNFDIDSKNMIFCSELPYQIFKDINFRVRKNLVRWTINPDDVAILAGKSGDTTKPFSLIYLNHNTKIIDSPKRFDLYSRLLRIKTINHK